METQWDRAFVPVDRREKYIELRKMIRNGFRKLERRDANTLKRDVIVVHVSGRATDDRSRLTFLGFSEYYANVGCVGARFAQIHIPSTGENIRSAYDNGYILIKDKKGE